MFEVLQVTGRDSFLRLIQASDMPVLVKLGHKECPPCIAVEPVLLKLAQDFGPDLRVVEINTRHPDNVELRKLAPYGVPQFLLFFNGDEKDTKLGFPSYESLRFWLVNALGNVGYKVAPRTERECAFSTKAAQLNSDLTNSSGDDQAYATFTAALKALVEDYLGIAKSEDVVPNTDRAEVESPNVCRLDDPTCRS